MKSQNKEKTKVAVGAIICIALVVSLVVIAVVDTNNKSSEVRENKCFVDIAKNYCEENGLALAKVFWGVEPQFRCKEERLRYGWEQDYVFLDEELERCLK